MEYDVIHDSDLRALITVLNARLSDGWKPCGGIAVVPSTPEGSGKTIDYYYQAIVRPGEVEVFHSQ
jgi:hypothetical protein